MRRSQLMDLTEKIQTSLCDSKPMINEQKDKLSEIMKNINREDKTNELKKKVKPTETNNIDTLSLEDCHSIIDFIKTESTLQEFILKSKEELEDGTASEIMMYALTLLFEDYNNIKEG